MPRQFRRLRPRAARLRAALAAPALALIAGCSSTSPPMAPGAAISMAPSAWQIRYSPGMPMQPVANAGGGWAFDFPSSAKGLCPAPATQPPDFNVSPCSHVDYVTVPYTAPITANSLTITLDVVASSPVYDYHTAPNNTCVTTAKARLLLEHTGDASLSNVVYRWWSTTEYVLGDSASGVVLTVPLTTNQWSDVDGQLASSTPALGAAFAETLQNMGAVGITFGGCFAGHGVYLDSVKWTPVLGPAVKV